MIRSRKVLKEAHRVSSLKYLFILKVSLVTSFFTCDINLQHETRSSRCIQLVLDFRKVAGREGGGGGGGALQYMITVLLCSFHLMLNN